MIKISLKYSSFYFSKISILRIYPKEITQNVTTIMISKNNHCILLSIYYIPRHCVILYMNYHFIEFS